MTEISADKFLLSTVVIYVSLLISLNIFYFSVV